MRRRTKIILTLGCAVAIGLPISMIVAGEDAPFVTPDADTVTVRSEQLTADITVDGTLGPLTRTITHQVGAETADTASVKALSASEPATATFSATEDASTTTSSSTTSTTSTTTTPPPPPTTTTTTTTGPAPSSTTTQPSRPDSGGPTAGPSAPVSAAQQDPVGGSGGQAAQAPTAAVTDIPSVGDVLEPGAVLYSADGIPTRLLPGTAPAWRTLETGLTGSDVAQLETYLAGLGYDVGTVDDAYTSATATAVSAWQSDLGLDETGQVPLGSVVFTNGTVTVTAVHVAIGDDLAPGDAVLDIAGTDLQATLNLDAQTAALIHPGQEFAISVRNGPTVTGLIASVIDNPRGGATAYASLSEQPEVAVLPLPVTARRQALATDTTLTVPAAALIKLDSGNYAIRLQTGELISVEVLATSGSTAAIATQELQPGDMVRSA